MAFTDPVIIWVVDQLLTDPVIGKAVKGRVHGRHIATIQEIDYPAITVSRASPGFADRTGERGFDLLIQTYSEDSLEEAWELQARIRAVLHGEASKTTGTHWSIEYSITPVDSTDTSADIVYAYSAIYRVRQVE